MTTEAEAAAARSEAARAVARLDEDKTKYDGGSCEELGKASVKCIEDHGYDRSHPDCQKHFDAYKECRKKQNDSRRQLKSLFF